MVEEKEEWGRSRREKGCKKRKYWERGKSEGEAENKNKEERKEKIMWGEAGRAGSRVGEDEAREGQRKKQAIT